MLNSDDRGDVFLFYGCAGVTDLKFVEGAFLVSDVSYLSLGSVVRSQFPCNPEQVRLKNKWMVRTNHSGPGLSLP